jgi:hypothetical protein
LKPIAEHVEIYWIGIKRRAAVLYRIRTGLRVAAVVVAMYTTATPADHKPNQIHTATFEAQCDTYSLRVSGRSIDKTNLIVGYNITLTPPSGEPLIITDSFSVVPNTDRTFRKTFTNSWKTFGFMLGGKYTLSGSAVLVTGLTPLSSVTIGFSPASLDCGRER